MGILKNQLEQSKLGLNGVTPPKRQAADIHVKGTSQPAEHSVYDLDGATPKKYTDNKPE
jgi:hypothetical protein